MALQSAKSRRTRPDGVERAMVRDDVNEEF